MRKPAQRTRHSPYDILPRHPHDYGFAAIVLNGGYVEAGDTGLHSMLPGDVLLHRPWESHLDRFDARGADVLVLPLLNEAPTRAAGRIADLDLIVRLADQDRNEAVRQLFAVMTPKPAIEGDWPEQLAKAICNDPSLSLSDWAVSRGLHPGTLSRGFRQVFGLTPSAFRLVQRTHIAIDSIRSSRNPLSDIAFDCGFADQAHMSRAIRRVTHTSPAALRHSVTGITITPS